jgi:hypothetical protein
MNRHRTRYSAKIPPPVHAARPAAARPSTAVERDPTTGGSLQAEICTPPEIDVKPVAEATAAPGGRSYRYEAYCCDPLVDERSYTRPPDGTRMQRRPPTEPLPLRPEPALAMQQPMMGLGITFGGICYRYRDYRYDQLAAAISRARLKQ